MATFEQGFAETERAAAATVQATKTLSSIALQMQKAAQAGNIPAIRRLAERLRNASAAARQEAANLADVWPFDQQAEEEYMRQNYRDELLSTAAGIGLEISRRDDALICFPSILRISPTDRSVQVDRKKVPNIRPSKLVSELRNNQQKPIRFRSEPFLEALYRVYSVLAQRNQQGMLTGSNRIGPVVPLSQVYDLFTALPGARAEYDQTSFARDLYLLDSSGVTQVRSGATVSFPASTGTRSARGTFSFVSREGEVVTYYGIQFMGGTG
jgi:hypothetical protein